MSEDPSVSEHPYARYLTPRFEDGADPAVMERHAGDYETFVNELRTKFAAADPEPLPGWSGNIWFDRVEARRRRWDAHSKEQALVWWRERGLEIRWEEGWRPVFRPAARPPEPGRVVS